MIEIWNKNPKKNKDTGKWEVKIYDPQGEFIRMQEFDTQSAAFAAIKEGNKKSDKSPVVQEKKKLQQEETFLENYIKHNSEEIDGDTDPNEFEMSAELIKNALEQYQKQFKNEVEVAEKEASGLLEQVAKAYLGADIIDKDEYMKYKIQLQTKDLGELVWQLSVAKKAIFRLSQEIEVGKPTKATYDALATMQKVSLEFVKFRQEYLVKLEENLKGYKVDLTMGIVGGGEGMDDNTIDDRDGNVIRTNDRKKLIKELDAIVKESREEVAIAKSANKKLHDDDPDVVEDAYEIRNDELDENVDIGDIGDLGLGTFEEDDDFDEEDK